MSDYINLEICEKCEKPLAIRVDRKIGHDAKGKTTETSFYHCELCDHKFSKVVEYRE